MNNEDPINIATLDRIDTLSKRFELFFKGTANALINVPEKDITDKVLYDAYIFAILTLDNRNITSGLTSEDLDMVFNHNKKQLRNRIKELKREASSSAAASSSSAAVMATPPLWPAMATPPLWPSSSSASASVDRGFSQAAANILRAERSKFINRGIHHKTQHPSDTNMNLDVALQRLKDKASSFDASDKYINKEETPVKHAFLLALIKHIKTAFDNPNYGTGPNLGPINYFIPPYATNFGGKRKESRRRKSSRRKTMRPRKH